MLMYVFVLKAAREAAAVRVPAGQRQHLTAEVEIFMDQYCSRSISLMGFRRGLISSSRAPQSATIYSTGQNAWSEKG